MGVRRWPTLRRCGSTLMAHRTDGQLVQRAFVENGRAEVVWIGFYITPRHSPFVCYYNCSKGKLRAVDDVAKMPDITL